MREDVGNSLTELRLTVEGASARLRFARDLPVFQGHFPSFPIVPGIYLIEAARLLGEHSFGESLVIRSIEVARFSAAIRPEDWVEASAVLDERIDPITCDARFRCRGIDAARIRMRLQKENRGMQRIVTTRGGGR